MTNINPDPIWESEIYSQGHHLNRYPFDAVVSFLIRYRPRDKPREQTDVLEIGCGFRVAGIDGSESAISFARRRFESEELSGDLRVGNFLKLPYENNVFDIGIDRCSLVCVGYAAQQVAIKEMHRVLRPGGIFFFNGYSDEHTSARSGDCLEDGRIANIRSGTLVGVGSLGFNTESQIDMLFADGWEILKKEHLRLSDFSPQGTGIHAEWRVVASRKC